MFDKFKRLEKLKDLDNSLEMKELKKRKMELKLFLMEEQKL